MSKVIPIKVLHIASGDLWAGAEVQLFTLVREQQASPDIAVCVALMNPGVLAEKLEMLGISVAIFDESVLNGLQILRQLMALVRNQQPNVIHTHRTKENIIGSIAARLSGGIPSLRTAHGAPEHIHSLFQIPKHIITTLDWFCGRFIQKKIIAVSDDLRNILVQRYPDTSVCVIENGIDPGTPEDNQNNSATENISNFKVGLAGRLVPVKRVDLFLQVAEYIQYHHQELSMHFYIYGDGPLRDQLQKRCNTMKIDATVLFMGHQDDIRTQLTTLDALLITSDHEGLPMIALEAMSLGVPVISHAVGGIPKLLDYGNCGMLVETQEASAYADQILTLSGSKQTRDQYAKNALKRVQTCYSAKRNAKEYQSVYAGLIGN